MPTNFFILIKKKKNDLDIHKSFNFKFPIYSFSFYLLICRLDVGVLINVRILNWYTCC